MMLQLNQVFRCLPAGRISRATRRLLVLTATLLACAAAQAQRVRTELSVQPDRSGAVLVAHVSDPLASGLLPAGGSVSFEIAQGSLGSALLDADGEATLSLANLAQSPRATTVQAVYHPTTDSPSSTSSPALLQPSASSGVPDFTLTATPSTIPVPQGQYGSSLITVTPVNGFSEQVTLSCSGLPAQATCSFSPVIASTASGAFTSTLEIQTQTASGALSPLVPGRSQTALAWLLPGAFALAGLAATRMRAFRGAALFTLLAAFTLVLGGCSQRYGYLHHPPIATAGTPKGSYTLTLSASGNDGSAVTIHTLPIVLQVQ